LTGARPIRVVVVDDSALFRSLFRELLEADGDIRVVGEAMGGEESLARVAALGPDLVTIDINMPGPGGLALVERIMALRPLPVLVVTAQPAAPGSPLVFEAVRRGALDVLAKEALSVGGGRAARDEVRRLAAVRVVRHLPVEVWRPPAAAPARRTGAARSPVMAARVRVIGVAASTGGPPAVAALLGGLPAGFGGCVALVQHMPVGFASSLARFVGDHCALEVAVVREATLPAPGKVMIAPDDHHLVLSSGGLFVPSDEPPLGGHRPSATLLFRSIARRAGEAGVGVVLSGMGDDGVDGLGQLRRAGGLTVAQDEASAALFGMPRAAIAAGAAEHVLPPVEIARLLAAVVATPG
jgi:two-component system chemotaxis response regulator CheB